ncbi:hypothetical protein AB5N19_05377 [Seiridium cardinale]
MAAKDPLKRDLAEVLDNVGHGMCRACAETASAGCAHNDPESLAQRLRNVLVQWLSVTSQNSPDEIQPMFYYLEERWSTHPSGAIQVRGADWAKFEAVQSLAAELQLNVYLAQLQRTESGIDYAYGTPSDLEETDEEDDGDEDPETAKGYPKKHQPSTSTEEPLEKVEAVPSNEDVETEWSVNVLLDGRTTVELYLDAANIIQECDFFDLEDPDEEDVDGEYGHGGVSYTRDYRAQSLAIIPQRSIGHFFSRVFERDQGSDAAAVLDYFASRCLLSPEDEGHFHVLRHVCSRWKPPSWTVEDPGAGKPWIAVQKMVLPSHLALKLLRIAVRHESQDLLDSVCLGLGSVMDNHFLSQLSDALQGTMLSLELLREPLIGTITSGKMLGDRYVSVISLCNAETISEKLRQYALEALDESVRRCEGEQVMEQDGDILILIAQHYRGFEWLHNFAVPLVQKKCHDAAFAIGFMWKLYLSACQEAFPREAAFDLVKSMVRANVANFHVSQLVSLHYWQIESARREKLRSQFGPNEVRGLPYLPAPAVIATLLNLVEVMVSFGMEGELKNLSKFLAAQCHLVPEQELYHLYIPFVCALVPRLERLPGICFSDESYQHLFLGIIDTYWQKHAQAKPPMHWGMLSKELAHKCAVCTATNAFLADRNKQKHTMSNHSKTGMRSHLLDTLRKMRGVSCEEDKAAGKCHLTKLTSDHHMETKEWEVRGFNVRAMLRRVDQNHLMELLGIHYPSMMGKSPQARPAVPATYIAQGTATGSAQNCTDGIACHALDQHQKPSPTHDGSQPILQTGSEQLPLQAAMPNHPCGRSSRSPLAPVSPNHQPITGTKRKFDGVLGPSRSPPAQIAGWGQSKVVDLSSAD